MLLRGWKACGPKRASHVFLWLAATDAGDMPLYAGHGLVAAELHDAADMAVPVGMPSRLSAGVTEAWCRHDGEMTKAQ